MVRAWHRVRRDGGKVFCIDVKLVA
jgi:hypothetical protein